MANKSNQNSEIDYSCYYIPTLKMDPEKIVFYSQVISDRPKFRFDFSSMIAESEKRSPYSGDITESSKRRMKKALNLLFYISKRKWVYNPTTKKNISIRIVLQTLTLSAEQGHLTDREIKKELLEPYLRKMRGKGMKNYVWKAERQKNGNIHFHILTDTFIPAGEIRMIWNRLQWKLGFITQFYEKHGHYDPNSTDVKKVESEKGMVNYMLKYMLKPVDKDNEEESQEITEQYDTGKIWDCSLNLKIKNDTELIVEREHYDKIEQGISTGDIKEFKSDYFTIFYLKGRNALDFVPDELIDQFNEYIKKVKDFEPPS